MHDGFEGGGGVMIFQHQVFFLGGGTLREISLKLKGRIEGGGGGGGHKNVSFSQVTSLARGDRPVHNRSLLSVIVA